MKKIKSVEEFYSVVDKSYPGQSILVNVDVLLKLQKLGVILNAPNNRRPDESKWSKDNFRNYSERMEDASENFKIYGESEDYFGLMDSISLFIDKDGNIYTEDGAHRFDFFGKVNEFFFNSKTFLKDIPLDSFFSEIINNSYNKEFSDRALKVFKNCFIPIKFSNGNNLHYVGTNSAKTMKAQQILRVSFVGNEIFDYGQNRLKDISKPFNLTAVGNSSEETSTADTISLMALAGGDAKGKKSTTVTYFLDKYTDKESKEKFIECYDRFLNIMSSNFELFNFAFQDGKFRNIQMYGLIHAARELGVKAYCNAANISFEKRMKQIEKDKDVFFFTLNSTLDVLESKGFSKIISKTKEKLNETKVDANNTGSFSRGAEIKEIICNAVQSDKNGNKKYPVKFKVKTSLKLI